MKPIYYSIQNNSYFNFIILLLVLHLSFSKVFGLADHDYKVTENGKISLDKTTTDSFDRLIAVMHSKEKICYKKDGTPIQHSITINKKTLSTMLPMKDKHYGTNYSGLKLNFDKNDLEAKAVFEFLSDNTMIEWSLLVFAIGEESRAHIYTSFQYDLEYFGASKTFHLLHSPHLITSIKHYHNHPRTTLETMGKYAFPSNPDIDFRDHVLKKGIQQVEFKIRTDGFYVDYGNPAEWQKGSEKPFLL